MSKTKAQLRAEAVERLSEYEYGTSFYAAVIGDDYQQRDFTWEEIRDAFIDLLTDDSDSDCFTCSRLAELVAENSQLRVELEKAKASTFPGSTQHYRRMYERAQSGLEEVMAENRQLREIVGDLNVPIDSGEASMASVEAFIEKQTEHEQDSREKLEAKAREFAAAVSGDDDCLAEQNANLIIWLLDRAADIRERELTEFN